MIYPCPVCGYSMDDPALNYNVCPCCGTEFGYHTVGRTYDEIRREWLRAGAQWWSPVDQRPEGWNPYLQLIQAGLTASFEPGGTQKSEKFFIRPAAPIEFGLRYQ